VANVFSTNAPSVPKKPAAFFLPKVEETAILGKKRTKKPGVARFFCLNISNYLP